MNKLGQVNVIAFVGVVVALLILAPIMLLIVNETLDGFSTAVNSTDSNAADNVDYIHDSFTSMWDWLIAIAFLVNVILLFVFAFMVDSHPIFALFYLIAAVLTLMFSHYVMVPIETILGMSQFSTEVGQLPITNFIVRIWDLLLLGIIIVTGIITYGRFKNTGLQR